MTDAIEKALVETRAGRDVGFFDLHSVDQVSTIAISTRFFDIARAFRANQLTSSRSTKGGLVNAFFEASTHHVEFGFLSQAAFNG